MKAARYLVGMTTKELARRLAERGEGHRLSYSTLKLMEQQTRDIVPPRDLRAIAAACDLPAEWFWVPSMHEAVSQGAELLGISSELRLDELVEQIADEEAQDLPRAQGDPGNGERRRRAGEAT